MDMAGRQQACTGRSRRVHRPPRIARPNPRHCSVRIACRIASAAAWIPAARCRPSSRLRPGRSRPSSSSCSARKHRPRRPLRSSNATERVDLDAVLKEVTDFWDQTLGAIQVKTPDRSMDILVNGWLLYQTLACRVWARTAFYQSSGAYGFRDQLQDVMALMRLEAEHRPRTHPARRRRASSRRETFSIGGCPTTGQGVKTRVSDDRIWLPFVRRPLPGGHGGLRRAGRAGAVPGGRPPARRQPRELFRPRVGHSRLAVRALRPRA